MESAANVATPRSRTRSQTRPRPASASRGKRLSRALLRLVLDWYARRPGSLNRQIQALTSFSVRLMPRRIRDAIASEQASTRALGELATARKAGDEAPAFCLPDHQGRQVSLDDLATDGFAVLAFLRGGWCPACNLELRALARHGEDFRALGARVAVLSPELPGRDASFESMSPVDVPILVDRGNEVARAFGVAHRFGDSLREILAFAGTDLAEHNGDDSFVLPIPAVYVVDRTRRIRFAYVFGSYIDRLEPEALLEAIRGLEGGRATAETPDARPPHEKR